MSWCEQLTERPKLPAWSGPAQVYMKLSAGDATADEDDVPSYTPPKERPCSRCARVLPLTVDYFFRNRREKTGFMSECKECHKLRDREAAQLRYAKKKERSQATLVTTAQSTISNGARESVAADRLVSARPKKRPASTTNRDSRRSVGAATAARFARDGVTGSARADRLHPSGHLACETSEGRTQVEKGYSPYHPAAAFGKADGAPWRTV